MGKIYFTFLVLMGLFFDNANAQNTFPPTGNVGIGISPAAYPLHVRNTDATNRARFHFGVGTIDLVTYSTGTLAYSNSSGVFVNNHDAIVMAGSNKDIRFVTHPSDYMERMRIKANGDIGIGTITPRTKLDVNGSISSIRDIIAFNPSNPEASIHIGWLNDIARIRIGGSGTGNANGMDIQTTGDKSLMRLLHNGNVGIGTASPSHKLEVNGTIRAKEIKLEATAWPDYVFEDGYELMLLEEVKTHIDQNGHLPGLKPAKEYEEEGVNIMELNQKLLEKIEELTLYVIELRNEVDDLKVSKQQ